jgi:hypothetical protein
MSNSKLTSCRSRGVDALGRSIIGIARVLLAASITSQCSLTSSGRTGIDSEHLADAATDRLGRLIALDVLTVPIVLLNMLPLLALYAAQKRINDRMHSLHWCWG